MLVVGTCGGVQTFFLSSIFFSLHQDVINLVVGVSCLGCAMFIFWMVCEGQECLSILGC